MAPGLKTIGKAVLALLLIAVIAMAFFPKILNSAKPFLAWTGIIQYGPIDDKYMSLIKTEPKTIVMALDPTDWKSSGETFSCTDRKSTISLIFDRRFSESAKNNPSTIFSIYESVQCTKDTSKKEDYSGPIMLSSNADGSYYVSFEDRKMDTLVTISNIVCCDGGTKSYLIKLNLEDEINREGLKMNPSTSIVKFRTKSSSSLGLPGASGMLSPLYKMR